MTSVSKNFYIDKLDDIVDEHNNTYHRTIKMRPVDVKDPNFKVGDHVRISKYKNFFAKGYTPNWSQEVFVIKKVKNAAPQTYVINDLNGEEIIGTFYEKELQKTNEKEFRTEKVIKEKVINYMLNGKIMIIYLIVGLIKKIQCDSIIHVLKTRFLSYKSDSIFS